MQQRTKVIVGGCIVILIAAVSYWGGSTYGRRDLPNEGAFGQRGGAMLRGGRDGAAFVNGEVVAKDDTSVTLKLRDGGSRIVFLSATTEISRYATGSLQDVFVGASVMVNGTSNTDGSMTAQSVQVRPAGMIPMGAGPAPVR